MQQNGNYNFLIEKIDGFIRRYYLNKLLRGLIYWGIVLLTGYLFAATGEYFGHFPVLLRTIIFYAYILLNLLILCWQVAPPLLSWLQLGSSIDHHQAAQIIGEHFAEIKDKLLNTLQLKELADQDPLHRQLIEAGIGQKVATLQPLRFPAAVNLRENRKYLKWILLPALAIGFIAVIAPAMLSESTTRLIKHSQYFAPVAPFQFILSNENLSVTRGDGLKIDVRLKGNQIPADVYIETDGHTFRLDKQSVSKFNYQYNNLQKTTIFRLSGGGYTSAAFKINVNERPELLNFDADLVYPPYLHKANEQVTNAGDLTIPAGTVVKWHFRTENTSNLVVNLNGSEHVVNPSIINNYDFSSRIIKSAIYSVQPVNTNAAKPDAATYKLNVVADEAPAITATQKQDSVSMKALYFSGKAQDDHGFTWLTFNYKVRSADSGKEFLHSQKIKTDLKGPIANFFYYWDIKTLKANPGDHVSYYFEVADNDMVTGVKKARTAEQELDMPTARQMSDQLNNGSQQVKQKMVSAAKLAAQLERDAQRLNQAFLNKNNLNFDEKKQVEDLMQKKKDLDALVKQLQDENKKNLYNRQQNEKQTQELTQLQNEMDKLLQDLVDPKTQEMLQKLQELLQQDEKSGTRDELQKMHTDNKSMKKELDRMLELYKKLEFEQKLNQQIQQLDQLANKQQKLAEQAAQQSVDKQTAQQKQSEIKNEFDEVKKSLNNLAKQSQQDKQSFENPAKDQQNIDEQLEKANEQLGKNNLKNAAGQQQQAADAMKKLSQKLQQENAEQEGQQLNLNARQLRELLKNLINSSFNQEKLMQTFKTTSASDPNYVNLSQQQKNIKDDLKTAQDSLFALSKRIPQIQAAVNIEITTINDRIAKAIENLGDRRTPEAIRNQQYAMTAMNNLALMLNEVLDQLQNAMKNAKSGKGKQQQNMQQISRMQQQLNNNMQKMRNQMQQQPGGNKGQSQQQGQSEQLARMARQQQAIRQALQQYNRDLTKNGGGNAGNLDKIAKDMEQTERDLVNRHITDESINLLQQIQTRLLEAEKAEQEREQDKQRIAKVGKDIPPGYIKALQSYEKQKTKQTEQLRTVAPQLNLYYKQRVKKYFEQINGK